MLARWTSWGALSEVFDEGDGRYAPVRDELRELLGPEGWRAGSRTTLNAHYTDTAYAPMMWQVLADLGFTGGEVLEPGCGAGTFIAAAPAGVHVVGIELDPTTAAIASLLHPAKATVYAESFADTRLPSGSFDAVIGNVPFGRISLYDPHHNPDGLSIHNHFIVKSLALLKPGGLMVVLTSRYTLDAKDTTARERMYALADLVGALRLPTGAHARAAGTAAVTDLLVLRRRPPGEAPGDPSWLQVTAPFPQQAPELWVNTHFRHGRHVLGTFRLAHGQFSAADLTVEATRDRGVGLRETVVTRGRVELQHLARDARRAGLTHCAAAHSPVESPSAGWPVERAADPALRLGHLRITGTGVQGYAGAQRWDDIAVPGSHRAELGALLGLRDALGALLTAETAAADPDALTAGREALNRLYDAYRARYGPINRFSTARTGRVDEDGNDILRQVPAAAVRALRGDPLGPAVRALEVFDPTTQSATKASIFRERVIAPRQVVTRADTPADALAVCLDTHGRVDLATIAGLLDLDETQARHQLGALVFHDPHTDRLVPAAEYLSGNVRTKLTTARQALDLDPRYAVNVTELEKVQPEDLGPDEIQVAFGAVWIPADVVTAFLLDTLADEHVRVHHIGGSEWLVENGDRHSVAATSTWGTGRLDALTIVRRLLRQEPIRVSDKVPTPDGGQIWVINPTETDAANEKAEALKTRFAEWAWEDPARAHALTRRYNDTFNAIRLRTYDTTHMRLPGLALTFTPHPHQLAAAARMVAEPAVGLFHDVGAGKTAEMVIGVMELRRLGLVRKPAVVVPNHMLEQFAREFLQLYPQARILAAGSADLPTDKRRQFVGRIATGDWDAVIMTRTAFEALPVSVDAQRAYESDRMTGVRDQLSRAQDTGSTRTVKRLEGDLLRAEERLKKLLDKRRDTGVSFEQTGIDYLVVDELHEYKNLTVISRIPGVGRIGSQRATDLDMKIHTLRRTVGDRVITGATATPIANTVSEAYVMQAYLRPDLLTAAGLTDFDAWAATFGQTVTELELTPAGGTYRMNTRFARFCNIPEMLRLWHVSADVKTGDDLGLPVPALRMRTDGTRAAQTLVVQPSPDILHYVAGLAARADKVKSRAVTPDEDNMLLITTDGRKAALDLRLVTATAPTPALLDAPTKIAVAAARIHQIWTETRHLTYLGDDGTPSPHPGALQIVFCDLSTPSTAWNVYDELKAALTERGLDPARIRYIHDANTDPAKATLFSACRSGQVDVILGSTSKMGVGTNIQRRAIALHHLDCPWRPADIAQREGRILRQGNQNPEVGIYRYVVERTFDAYMWQTVERKARFIAQVMRGRLDVREVDDVGDTTLSYGEVKALASGDPRVLERAAAEQAVTKLERLERAHNRGQSQLLFTATTLTGEIDTIRQHVADLEPAIAGSVNTSGTAFAAIIAGHRHTERPAAATALRQSLAPQLIRLHEAHRPAHTMARILTLGGHTFDAHLTVGHGQHRADLTIPGVPANPVTLIGDDILNGDGHGIITRIENRVAGLPELRGSLHRRLERCRAELAAAQDRVGMPFPRAGQLQAARTRLATVIDAMSPREPAHTQTPAALPAQANPGAPTGSDALRRSRDRHTEPAQPPESQRRSVSR